MRYVIRSLSVLMERADGGGGFDYERGFRCGG